LCIYQAQVNTAGAKQLPHRASVMEQWLDRRRLVEAGVQLFSGLLFAFLGVIVLAAVSAGVVFLIYIALMELEAILAFRGPAINLRQAPLVVVLWLMATVFCFIGAHKHRYGLDYSSGGAGLEKTPEESARLFLNPLWEVLFAGPSLLLTAYEDLDRSGRLMRLETEEVAAVVRWVFEQGGKAEVGELTQAFAGINTVRIFPQLRDLPGVIWLLENRGVLLLSEEIRAELAALLGEPAGQGRVRSETAGAGAEERPREHYPEVSEEVQSWYETLGVSPFAPLREVKRKYRLLVKIHHPDVAARNPGLSGQAADERIKQINLAYHNILKHSGSKSS
jgi:DnaJ domain